MMVLKVTLVLCFGPNLKLWFMPELKLNKIPPVNCITFFLYRRNYYVAARNHSKLMQNYKNKTFSDKTCNMKALILDLHKNLRE